MSLSLILSAFSFLLFLGLHFYVFHNYRVKKRFRRLIVIAVFSLLVYILCYTVLLNIYGVDFGPQGLVEIGVGLFAYLFWAYFYFMHVVLVSRSITTRFMVEIGRSRNKRLGLEEIKKSFSVEKKLQTELEDMQLVGRIVREGEYFKNTPKGRRHAQIIGFLKRYLNLDK